MPALVSLGTSASKGLGLHLYNRDTITNNGLIDMNVTEDEYLFNLDNSYSNLLAEKLGYKLTHINTGYNYSFYTQMDELELSTDTKVVILQLSNLHRDFFIYNNNVYKIDFETYDGFVKSRKELIKDKDIEFINALDEDLELFVTNERKWRDKQSAKMIQKIDDILSKLKNKSIQLKVIMYFDDWLCVKEYFVKNNLFVSIKYNDKEYDTLFDFVIDEKLRISDELEGCTDGHPNFKAHKIIANQLYDNIKIEPLYSTI